MFNGSGSCASNGRKDVGGRDGNPDIRRSGLSDEHHRDDGGWGPNDTNYANWAAVVPEPGTLVLLSLGLSGLAWGGRCR